MLVSLLTLLALVLGGSSLPAAAAGSPVLVTGSVVLPGGVQPHEVFVLVLKGSECEAGALANLDTDGLYSFSIEEGETFTVGFLGTGIAGHFIGDAFSCSTARTYTASPGLVIPRVTLYPGVEVDGELAHVDSGASVPGGATVALMRWNTSQVRWELVSETGTGGTFAFERVLHGTSSSR